MTNVNVGKIILTMLMLRPLATKNPINMVADTHTLIKVRSIGPTFRKAPTTTVQSVRKDTTINSAAPTVEA